MVWATDVLFSCCTIEMIRVFACLLILLFCYFVHSSIGLQEALSTFMSPVESLKTKPGCRVMVVNDEVRIYVLTTQHIVGSMYSST